MRPTMNKALFHTFLYFSFSLFLFLILFNFLNFFTLLARPRNFTKHQTPNEQPVERKLVSMGKFLAPLCRMAVAMVV